MRGRRGIRQEMPQKMLFLTINDVGGPLGPVDDCSRDYPTLRGRGIVYIVRILNLANYSSLITKIDIPTFDLTIIRWYSGLHFQ
jgi:hypothetical protein